MITKKQEALLNKTADILDKLAEKCGGPGGKPGPCPVGGAEKPAAAGGSAKPADAKPFVNSDGSLSLNAAAKEVHLKDIQKDLKAAGVPGRIKKDGEKRWIQCAAGTMETQVANALEKKAGWKKLDSEAAYGGYSGSVTMTKGKRTIVLSSSGSKPCSIVLRKVMQ